MPGWNASLSWSALRAGSQPLPVRPAASPVADLRYLDLGGGTVIDEDVLPFRIVEASADIGAAINTEAALLGSTGGVILLPAGVHNSATAISPTLPNVWIRGAGIDATTIKLTGTNRGFSISNTPNLRISDLTVDCNKANTTDNGTTTQHGIFFSAFNSTGCPGAEVQRVRVINAWDRGIAAAATTLDAHPLDLDIVDCVVSGTIGTGIVIQNAQRCLVADTEVYATLLWGIHIIGGRGAVIRDNRCHDSAAAPGNRGHGIVVNTGNSGATITGNHCYNNTVDSSTWGIVVGTSATRFRVAENHCYSNSQNITIDVSDGTSTPIDTRGVVADNVCTASTAGNGLHVNQADGLTITGNHCSHNTQTGLEVYGRNCVITGNLTHHNGWHGISIQEDGVSAGTGTTGPHIVDGNYSYANNTSATGKRDYFVDTLTNGGVVGEQPHVINVKTYGAVGNGVTDDSLAIRTAAAVALSLGWPLFFPPGIYLLNSVDGNGNFVTLTKGIEIYGLGATIKIGTSVTDWNGVFGTAALLDATDMSGLDVHHLTFDGSSGSNPITTTNPSARRYIVHVWNGVDIRVHDNYVKDWDARNLFLVDGRVNGIENAYAYNNVGKNIGGAYWHDHSAFFLSADYVSCYGNQLEGVDLGSTTPSSAWSAFELHGRLVECHNNVCEFYFSFGPIVSLYPAQPGENSKGYHWNDNISLHAGAGFTLWPQEVGDPITDIHIHHNTIEIDIDRWKTAAVGTTASANYYPGIVSPAGHYGLGLIVGNSYVENLRIEDNDFVWLAHASAAHVNDCGIFWAHTTSQASSGPVDKHISICRNKFSNTPCGGIYVQWYFGLSDWDVSDNTFYNIGNGAFGENYQAGMTVLDTNSLTVSNHVPLEDIRFNDNKFIDDQATHTLSYPLLLAAGSSRNVSLTFTSGSSTVSFVAGTITAVDIRSNIESATAVLASANRIITTINTVANTFTMSGTATATVTETATITGGNGNTSNVEMLDTNMRIEDGTAISLSKTQAAGGLQHPAFTGQSVTIRVSGPTYIDARTYGVDATGIQKALTAAGASGTVVFPPATYNIGTTGLTATGSIDMKLGASLTYSGSGIALLVDNTDRCTYNVDIRRATVNWHTGTDTTSIGLQVKNSDYARIKAVVHNFETGINLHGDASGSSYGVLDCINVMDNKRGVRFSQVNTGWANQWEVRGQVRINSAYTGISGSRYIDMSNAGNNITFINMTLEANTPAQTAYIATPYNCFLNCRFEDTTGITYDGTSTQGNVIIGGYGNLGPAGGAGAVPITLVNSAVAPLLLSSFGSSFGIDGTSAYIGKASSTIAQFVGTWRFPTAPQFSASATNPKLHLGVNVGDPKIFAGTGSPEGVVTATIGSHFHRSDGGAGTSFYVKESGSGNTGWVAK